MPDYSADERLMQLVEAALVRPEGKREAWLQQECSGETELIAEVLERAAWEDRMGVFLHDPVLRRTAPRREELFAKGSMVAGRYRIVREVGRGRASVVMEAFDTETEARVAIKNFSGPGNAGGPTGHGVVRRFELAEVETDQGPVAFCAMELLEGPTLAERLHEEGGIPVAEARAIGVCLRQALRQARREGYSPAALSARGVILTSRGPVLTEEWVSTGPAPQAEAADIAALGTIFRRMASGEAEWDHIVGRCLGTGPAGRYRSLDALEKELQGRGGIGHDLMKRFLPGWRAR